MDYNKTKSNLIFGRHPILEALQADRAFDKIMIAKGSRNEVISQILKLTKANDIPVQFVPVEKLNRVTRKNHQGVLGFAALIPYYSLEDVLSQAYDKGEVPFFLLCDGITDVRNFGAIARTALCAGVHGLVTTLKGTAPINAEAIKASAGALENIPVIKVRFLDKAIDYLIANGLQVIASASQADKYVKDIDWTIPTALIMGAEDHGVSEAALKKVTDVVKIPIMGDFDSYNVSVATGMIVYERLRQL